MVTINLPQREEYLKKKRKQRQIRYGIFAFIFLLFFSVFVYVSHRPEFRITNVELTGGILVTQDDVKSKVIEYLGGSYFYLFPKNNYFWYPDYELESYLKENFKRIDTINIRNKGFKTLQIVITERKPFAIWCNTVPGLGNAVSEGVMEDGSQNFEDCYFIDQNSTIFAPAPQFSGDAYFKYYGLISGATPIGKEYMASSTVFREIADFVSRTKEMKIRPQYIVAKEKDDFSLAVSGGGEIYFDIKEPLTKVGDNLEALLKTPEMTPNSSGNLPIQYIDLRYGNKLFYKLKGEQNI